MEHFVGQSVEAFEMSMTIHTVCRSCGNTGLREVFSLPPMHLANAFRLPGEPMGEKFPLTALWCEKCNLAQLRETVDPYILYNNYAYVTSTSQTMLRHFESLWSEIKSECSPESAIEIGSNDGRLLQFLRDRGVDRVCGVEPAYNLVELALKEGITTINGLFDNYTAHIVHGVVPKCDLIVARHVFAHVDDWQAFVKNLDAMAQKETLIAIEVPYLVDMLQGVELDSIYHEHLSYVSIHSILALLEHTPFHIHRVMFFPIHGGAMVLFLRRDDSDRQPFVIPYESIQPTAWVEFAMHANRRIEALKLRVRNLVASGKTVCGFGASAKSSVWIQACGFTENEISFICDCTEQKQGRCSPGTEIPIEPESSLSDADVAVLFSWNFAREIIENNDDWVSRGGIFIDPHRPNLAEEVIPGVRAS